MFQEISLPKTVLFVDKSIANVLAMTGEYKQLIPHKILMISTLDQQTPETISNYLSKLLSTNAVENTAIAISLPIQSFQEQIETIASFPEFTLVKIFVASPNIGTIPESISESIIQPISVPNYEVSQLFHLYPTIPSTIEEQYELSNSVTPESIAEIIKSIVNGPVRPFYVGSFSNEIGNLLLPAKGENPESSLLLVDRREVAGPIFTASPSLLDVAAENDLISTLRDKEIVSAEIGSGSIFIPQAKQKFLRIIKEKIGAPTGQCENFQKLYNFWTTLSEEKKRQIAEKNPAIPNVFCRKMLDEIQLAKIQQKFLGGAPIGQMIETLDFKSATKLIGFASFVEQSIKEDPLGFMNTLTPQKCQPRERIEHVILHSKASDEWVNDVEESYGLPAIISTIYDDGAPVSPRISTCGGGLFGLFREKKTVRDFKSIYVVVLGGISFAEMNMITTIAKAHPKKNVQIISDTLVSCLQLIPYPTKEQEEKEEM